MTPTNSLPARVLHGAKTSAPRRARGLLRRVDAALAAIEERYAQGGELISTSDALRRHAPGPVPLNARATADAATVTVLGNFGSGALFGGIATLIAFAVQTAHYTGRPLRIVETQSAPQDPANVPALLKDLGMTVPAAGFSVVDVSGRRRGERVILPVNDDDIVIASAWWDAVLADSLPVRRDPIYLVQDYEPIFYANGDEQLAAEATYTSLRATPVFNTSVLHDFFLQSRHTDFATRGMSFEPAVLRPSRASTRGIAPRTLFFYGRPQVRRNLFSIGLEAIDIASRSPALRDWSVVTAGDASLPDIELSGGQTMRSLGKVSLADYRELIGSAAVALSPMLAPHPNYPTLEFQQAGARVVSTAWESKTDLSRYGDGIDLVDPSAEALANGIVDACVSHDSGIVPRVQRLPMSWAEAFSEVISRLVGEDS